MNIFQLLALLDKNKFPYVIQRSRDDTISLYVTVVGERIEIDIFEDGHLEIARFKGNEDIEGGEELLYRLISLYSNS